MILGGGRRGGRPHPREGAEQKKKKSFLNGAAVPERSSTTIALESRWEKIGWGKAKPMPFQKGKRGKESFGRHSRRRDGARDCRKGEIGAGTSHVRRGSSLNLAAPTPTEVEGAFAWDVTGFGDALHHLGNCFKRRFARTFDTLLEGLADVFFANKSAPISGAKTVLQADGNRCGARKEGPD